MSKKTIESIDKAIEEVSRMVGEKEIPADTSTDKLVSALAELVSARAQII